MSDSAFLLIDKEPVEEAETFLLEIRKGKRKI